MTFTVTFTLALILAIIAAGCHFMEAIKSPPIKWWHWAWFFATCAVIVYVFFG